ncbi:MAG: ABC transporter permease, partial [Blastocatellia bacterium]
MRALWQDLRYGARMLLKKPGFTSIAVFTLALGIGANTAIFSVVYAVLLRPLPYHEPERLTLLWTKLDKLGLEQAPVSEPEALDFREQSKLFEGFGVVNGSRFALTGNGEPEQLMRSFLRLMQVNPGFDPHNVLTMRLTLPQSKYTDGAASADFYRRLLEKIQALPGVESAAAISRLPLSSAYSSGPLTFEGVTANAERANLASFEVDHRVITPDYFKTMKTPLLEGRFFTPQDTRDRPFVAIIDETLARRLWPNASPLGRRLTFGRFPDKPRVWVEIVGVVKHIRYHKLEGNVLEQVHFPHAQYSLSEMTLAIRAASDPLSMVGAARGVVQSLDRDQPIYRIYVMD